MDEEQARKILEPIVNQVKSYSRCEVILHIIPIDEGFISSFQFNLEDWENIPYSGPTYIVDKLTSMYYMIPSGWSVEQINEYIRRGRKSYLFRLKEKIVNFFYRYIS